MSQNPFGDMFGDIFSLLANQGPDAWMQTATQLAHSIARGEDGDPNPSPADRQRLEEFEPLVGRRVAALFEIVGGNGLVVVNRTGLVDAALAQWRPLIEPGLARSAQVNQSLDTSEGAMMAQMASTLAPMMMGFQLGSVAGHFSERAWSLATLPLPRLDAQRLIVVNNVASFAEEWSLERDEVFVFALAHEIAAAFVLSQPGTGDALRALLVDTVNEAMALQGDIVRRLQALMETGDIEGAMSDPSTLLEGIDSVSDSRATRAINAATSVLSAFFTEVASSVVTAMFGPRPALDEAYRRHRVEDVKGEETAAALFGIAARGPHLESAQRFVRAITREHGLEAFGALLRVDGLPLADELDDPSAWFERVTNSPLA